MQVVFRAHSLQRMLLRDISVDDVHGVLDSHVIVEDYPEDFPFPSKLMLGFIGERPLHIVAAFNVESEETIIITVYEPRAKEWEPGFLKRRQ